MFQKMKLLIFFIITFHLSTSMVKGNPFQVLQPKTYTSNNSQYQLAINPSDRLGRVEGQYTFRHNNMIQWEKTLPFTLWEARITNKGYIVGYAYSGGRGRLGDFHISIISSQGDIILNEKTKRTNSRFLHTDPNPLAIGLTVDEENDRLIVRVDYEDVNKPGEMWWTYRISTGKPLKKLPMPGTDALRFIIAAKPILGTDLILIQWWRFKYYRSGIRDKGASFSLVNMQGDSVWTQSLPRDYNIASNEDAEDDLRHYIWKNGAILNADKPRQFDLYYVSKKLRVSFEVSRNEHNKWKVEEVKKSPYSSPKPSSDKPEPNTITEKSLPYLGEIVINSQNATLPSHIHDVQRFDFDQQGNICFLRRNMGESAALVLMDVEGDLLKQIDLKKYEKEEGYWSGLAWVSQQRFIITRHFHGRERHEDAWWVDFTSDKVESVPDFDCYGVKDIAGSCDGRFAVLSSQFHKYTIETSVKLYDPQGQLLCSIGENSDNNPQSVLSAEAVAITEKGQIAVLDNIKNSVNLFDFKGNHKEYINLEKTWKREPSYPSDIVTDREGGFVIHDFDGNPPYIHMAKNRSVKNQFKLKYEDGQVFETHIPIKMSPNNRLWVSDGHGLLRLTQEGQADKVLGKSPDANVLGKIASVSLDQNDSIYALDEHTATIHVFDKNGKLTHTCIPNPEDFQKEVYGLQMTISDQGDIFLEMADRSHRYIHFSKNGKRLGIKKLDIDDVSQKWYSQPGTGNCWVKGHTSIYLVSQEGDIIHTIRRKPDNNWLEYIGDACVALNGNIAVVVGPAKDNYVTPSNLSVVIYGKKGEPLQTVHIPDRLGSFPKIAFDGNNIVLAGNNNIVLMTKTGKPLLTFQPIKEKHQWLVPRITQSGELVVFAIYANKILRYQLPE